MIVIGAGNAALCAGLAAAEHSASVLVLERSAEEESGGNSRFTAGAFRCVYDGVEDLKALMPDLTAEEIANTDFGSYPEEKFFDDMGRVTEYRTDPDLCELLVKRSKETMRWMRTKGIRFAPIFGRQAFKVDGKVVAGFAAFKNHLSYLPHSGSVLPALAADLAGFEGTKGSLHFPVDQPLPPVLVNKLVMTRLRELGL